MIALSDLWAKTRPFQSIITHGVVSGAVAQVLTENFLALGCQEKLAHILGMSCEDLKNFIGYFVSLHDIGKIHGCFQSSEPGMRSRLDTDEALSGPYFPAPFRHELESYRAMKRIWSPCGSKTARKFAEILGAHHQGKTTQNAQPTARGPWERLQAQYEEQMRGIFYSGVLRLPDWFSSPEGPVEAMLLGIVILSDWIASSSYFDDAEAWDDTLEKGRDNACKFIRESGLEKNDIDFGDSFCAVWPNIPAGCERGIQQETARLFSNHKGKYLLTLLEAPMGEGKTEAGLYAAVRMAEQWKKNGFYVALPTSATANQMVSRMRDFLAMHETTKSVRLLHAMAWMVDDCAAAVASYHTEEEQYAAHWLSPVKRGLLSQYAVGTVDQVMMAAMFIKYGVLRLLGLSGKVLIIDEVHAYDAYMQNILEGLLEWCRALEIPVVLLSATLTPEKKQALLSRYTDQTSGLTSGQYPVVTAVTDEGELCVRTVSKVEKRQQYNIEMLPILHQPDQITEAAIQRVSDGGCLCVLLNTVKQAQETYIALKASGFDGELILFHSRFLAERRDEIERRCIRLFGKDKRYRPRKAILVATQVVEQSLDVDFDVMFSAAAPIDLLLQRMGRQFRHEDTIRPKGMISPRFTVLVPEDHDFGADGYVYPECLLKQTIHLLKGREKICVPEDIAQLVADGYDSAQVPPEELEKWQAALDERSREGTEADPYKLYPPDKKFRPLAGNVVFDDLGKQSYLSAKTRLSEPSTRLAVLDPALYDSIQADVKGDTLAVKNPKLAKMILLRSVSIRKSKYDKLAERYGLRDISGDKLIIGIKIISANNPCFEADPELGLLWKE